MILLRQQEICILTPPKCGTTSLHWAMCPPAIFCEGPQLDNVIGKHTWVLPWSVRNEIANHTVLIVGRHPYRRILSLFGHWKMWWGRPDSTFREFIETIVIPQRSAFLCLPISALIYRFQADNPGVKIIPFQFEQVDKTFKEYGIQPRIPIPHMYTSEHGTCEEELTRDLLDFVRLWGQYDFHLFNYSEEPWWDVQERTRTDTAL